MVSGVVSNCLIYGNTTGDRQHDAGAFRIDGGVMVACKIYSNVTTQAAGGGGVWLNGSGSALLNCLFYGNMTSGDGGGVYLSEGTVDNCTIIANTAGGSGGGIYRASGTAGTIRNSIVYNNTSGDAVYKNIYSTQDARVYYCCTTNPVVAGDGCITDDPLFVNPAAGDYRLQSVPVKSPCIDAGGARDGMEAERDVEGKPRLFGAFVDMGAFETWPAVPLLRPAGVFKVTDKDATVRGQLTWLGQSEAALFLCHGPEDGGTNRAAWANVIRLPGPIVEGFHEVAITHAAGTRAWCCRWFATNVNGAAWAEMSGGLMLGTVEVKASRRESTEEEPAAFVFTRPATATNGPLDVYFTLGGTGANGVDYDRLESPVVIPAGATEARLPVMPIFSYGSSQSKGVELTLAPGGYQLGLNSKASMVTKAQ
jgi:hypothetical protein